MTAIHAAPNGCRIDSVIGPNVQGGRQPVKPKVDPAVARPADLKRPGTGQNAAGKFNGHFGVDVGPERTPTHLAGPLATAIWRAGSR